MQPSGKIIVLSLRPNCRGRRLPAGPSQGWHRWVGRDRSGSRQGAGSPTSSGLVLAAVSARDPHAAASRLHQNQLRVPILAAHMLPQCCDIIVECAPAAAFASIVEPAVAAGRRIVALSAGALLDHMDLVERAAATGAQIVVPSGADSGTRCCARCCARTNSLR